MVPKIWILKVNSTKLDSSPLYSSGVQAVHKRKLAGTVHYRTVNLEFADFSFQFRFSLSLFGNLL